jgi:hypothetical protein
MDSYASIVAITPVTLIIFMILVMAMLPVAQSTAACDEKMSCLLFFWLFLVLGNLLKNASHFVSRLTLLKKSNELECWKESTRPSPLVPVVKLECPSNRSVQMLFGQP